MNLENRVERLERQMRDMQRELAVLKKRPTRLQEFTEPEICQHFHIDGMSLTTEATLKHKGIDEVIVDRVMQSPEVAAAEYLGGARYQVTFYQDA